MEDHETLFLLVVFGGLVLNIGAIPFSPNILMVATHFVVSIGYMVMWKYSSKYILERAPSVV